MEKPKYVYTFPTPIHEQIYKNCVDIHFTGIEGAMHDALNHIIFSQTQLHQTNRELRLSNISELPSEFNVSLKNRMDELGKFSMSPFTNIQLKLTKEQYGYFCWLFNGVPRNITRQTSTLQDDFFPHVPVLRMPMKNKMKVIVNFYSGFNEGVSGEDDKSRALLTTIQSNLENMIREAEWERGKASIYPPISRFQESLSASIRHFDELKAMRLNHLKKITEEQDRIAQGKQKEPEYELSKVYLQAIFNNVETLKSLRNKNWNP